MAEGARAKVAGQVGPVTCSPHCSYCCHSKIVSPTHVGVFIYLYLRRQGMWTKELRAKLVQADLDMTARTHTGWLMSRRPCPFLDEKSFGQGDCTIYPVRPEACAITHSVSGDGSKCAEVGGKNLVMVLDKNAVVPFLPLVMAVQQLCKPVVTTLPGSVLLAEAAIEQLPEPAVASIPIPDREPDESSAELFDGKYATISDGE
jgi:Fe-S-cluster containining protein